MCGTVFPRLEAKRDELEAQQRQQGGRLEDRHQADLDRVRARLDETRTLVDQSDNQLALLKGRVSELRDQAAALRKRQLDAGELESTSSGRTTTIAKKRSK